MKTIKLNLLVAMAVLTLAACNKDNITPVIDDSTPSLPEEMVTVNFSTKAPAFSNSLLTRASEKYPADLFRILAFRHNGTDYMYLNDVDFKGNLAYDSENHQFKGSAELPVGVYKFIPAFGLPQASDANVSLTDMSSKPALSNNLIATHTGTLQVVYLREDANISSDTLGTHTGTKNLVKATIKRAVARVDILFIRAIKNGSNYAETAGDPVFGTHAINTITMELEGLTPSVRLIDGGIVSGTPKATLFKVSERVASDNTNTTGSTIGNGTAENPYDFDAVLPAHIMKGGEYAYGPYVFPYATEGETTTLKLTVTSTPEAGGHIYERKMDIPGVQLMRNCVTLVKIYTQRGDFFDTKVSFEIGINEAWENSYAASGEAE